MYNSVPHSMHAGLTGTLPASWGAEGAFPALVHLDLHNAFVSGSSSTQKAGGNARQMIQSNDVNQPLPPAWGVSGMQCCCMMMLGCQLCSTASFYCGLHRCTKQLNAQQASVLACMHVVKPNLLVSCRISAVCRWLFRWWPAEPELPGPLPV